MPNSQEIRAARKHQYGDVQSDDVSYSEQGYAEFGAISEDRPACMYSARCRVRHETKSRLEQFQRSAPPRPQERYTGRLRPLPNLP